MYIAMIVLLSIIAAALSVTSADTSVTIITSAGTIRGALSAEGDVASFFNVPYAEAPVNALRFAAPVPKQPWASTLDRGRLAVQLDCPPQHIIPPHQVCGISLETFAAAAIIASITALAKAIDVQIPPPLSTQAASLWHLIRS